MLTQPVVFEHVQQSGFACVIQAQEHKFSRLLVQTWKENKQARKTPAGLSRRVSRSAATLAAVFI